MSSRKEKIEQELRHLTRKDITIIDDVFNFLYMLSENSYIYKTSGIMYHDLLDPNNPSLGGCIRYLFDGEEGYEGNALWKEFINKKWARDPYTFFMSITGGYTNYGSVYMFKRYSEERYEEHSDLTLKKLLEIYKKRCGLAYWHLGGPVRLNKLRIGRNNYTLESSIEADLKPHWIKLDH